MRPGTCAGETSARARDHEKWLHCSLYPVDSTRAGFLIRERVVRISEFPPVILLGGCETLAEVSRESRRGAACEGSGNRPEADLDDDSGPLVRDNFSRCV